MTMRRFSKADKALLISMYNSGNSIKHIAYVMEREKSSIEWALDALSRKGLITRNRLTGGRKEIKVRVSNELHKKLGREAALKHCSLGKLVEMKLRKLM